MFVSSILLVLLLYHFDTAYGFHTHSSSVAASVDANNSPRGSAQPMDNSTQSTPVQQDRSDFEEEQSSSELQPAERNVEGGGRGGSSGRADNAVSNDCGPQATVGRWDSRDHRDMEVNEVMELALKLD